MNSIYLESHFYFDAWLPQLPDEFAIITAYATTGETWTTEENSTADGALADDLARSGKWYMRITGYSPATGHAEPGWAVEMGVSDACDLGLRYLQDAIYFVSGDELWVSLCGEPRGRALVGGFRERIQINH